MSIRCKTMLTSRLWLLLACGAAVVTSSGTAGAADLQLKPHLRSYAAAGKSAQALSASNGDITGTVNARTPSGEPILTVAVARARAARARFNEARHALERAMLLREAAPKADIATLEAAMKDVFADLAALEHARSADAVRKAENLAQDWYAAGLKIVKPPAEGVTELPLPMKVRDKADAVAAALDQVLEQTVAEAPPPSQRSVKPPKRRAATRPYPASTEAAPFEAGAPVVSVE
jgi:hypothetical protein